MKKLVLAYLLIIFIFGCTTRQQDNETKEPIVNSKSPYTSSVLASDLQQIAGRYQQFVELSVFGKSYLGKDLHLIKLGSGEQKVIFVGAHHGREWITSLLLVKAVEQYAQLTARGEALGDIKVADLLQEVQLLFVPMLNPDGVDIAINGLAAGDDENLLKKANQGEKDFTRWKANGRGVNLNIQYNANWEQATSYDSPHFGKYKGENPESELETQAMVALVKEQKPSVAVAYHSSGQVIYWLYGQASPFYERDKEIACKISEITGYQLAKEDSIDSHGGFKDWFIQAFQKPAFTIEVGEKVEEKPVALENFQQIWEENKEAILYLAQKAKEIN